MPTIWIFHSVETWQLVHNTVTSVLAFLLIALLQNSERRYDARRTRRSTRWRRPSPWSCAISTGGGDQQVERAVAELEDAIGLEERT